MATRVTPVAQVELVDAGQQHQVKYDGFARTDLVAELLGNGEARCNLVDWRGVPVLGSGARYPAAMTVDRGGLNCVIARPFLDVSQSIGLGHFTVEAGTWSALKGLGLPNEVKLYQSDGSPNRSTSVLSNFELPTNPVFCISLYRAEPSPEHDWASDPPYTEVHFGIGLRATWALVLPYAGPLYLMHHGAEGWQQVTETEGSVHVPTLEGFAAGQRLLLWVAALRGRIVMSTDGFAEDVWVYEVPGYTLRVPKGRVRLQHNAGQWMFSFFGIKMPSARIDSGAIEAGYDTQDSLGEVMLSIRHGAVVDDQSNALKQAVAEDTTTERTDLTVTQRTWQALLEPYVHQQEAVGIDPESGEPVDFTTCVSPELYAVQMGQYAEVLDNGEPASEEISPDVRGVSGDHAEHLQTVAYELELDNQLGRYAGLEEYRRAQVSLGWRLSDGEVELTPTVSGYLVEPPAEVLPGGAGRLAVTLLDPMIRLRDEKADTRCPVFDGWAVKDVLHWVLDRCGLHRSEQLIEDTGTRLSLGQPERPLWYPEPGRPWLDFLLEVCRFDYNAGLHFDEEGRLVKGCRYCREQRTAEDAIHHDGGVGGACPTTVDWELYTRGSVAPQADAEGEVLRLTRPRRTLSAREFANYVVVCGIGPGGRPVSAAACDVASLYDSGSDRYVGWRKMHVEALESYTSQDLVNRLCQERLAELARRPEHIQLVTPLNPGIHVGQVIAVHGGESTGADGQKYRVTGVRHRVRRSERNTATTAVTARWLAAGNE